MRFRAVGLFIVYFLPEVLFSRLLFEALSRSLVIPFLFFFLSFLLRGAA